MSRVSFSLSLCVGHGLQVVSHKQSGPGPVPQGTNLNDLAESRPFYSCQLYEEERKDLTQ